MEGSLSESGSQNASASPASGDIAALLDFNLCGFLEDKARQAALAKLICDESNLTGLSVTGVRLAVAVIARLSVIAVRAAGAEASEVAKRKIESWIEASRFAGPIKYGLTKFRTKFNMRIEGEEKFNAIIGRVAPETEEFSLALPPAVRADMAQISLLERLLDGQADIRARLEDVANPQPLFRDPQIEDTDANRFFFGARRIPFFGRENEFGLLNDFVNHPDAFRWMVVHGAGGVGKSRLGLEYILARAGGWDCGFLNRYADQPDWNRWTPQTPHFLIIDYPASAPQQVGALIRALSARGKNLTAPVRVLLLERENAGEWRTEIGRSEGGRKALACENKSPELETVGDLWPIFEKFLGAAAETLDRQKILARLGEIDPQRRPLFAAFLADALAKNADARHWDRERLLRDVLARDEERYWWTGFDGREADKTKLRRLAAFITLCDGLSCDEIKSLTVSLHDLFSTYDVDDTPKSLARILGAPAGERFNALQPDMLGELFFLGQMASETPSAEKRLVAAAHRVAGDRAIVAALRSRIDYEAHGALVSARSLGRLSAATAYFNRLTMLRGSNRVLTQALYDKIKRLATGFDELALSIIQAQAAGNWIYFLGNNDIDQARARYNEIREIVSRWDDAIVRQALANAAMSLVKHVGSFDIGEANAVYTEIRELAGNSGESALRLGQAKVAVNLIKHVAPTNLSAALTLYQEVKDLSSRFDEGALREEQAKLAFILMKRAFPSNITVTLQLEREIINVAAEFDSAKLRETLARSAIFLIKSFVHIDATVATSRYDDLKNLAAQYDEANLYEAQAYAALVLITERDPVHVEDAQARCEEIASLALMRPNLKALTHHWALAVEFIWVDMALNNRAEADKYLMTQIERSDAMRDAIETIPSINIGVG